MSVQLITDDQEKRRIFTPEQKFQILNEWERTGNGVKVAQKYQIHPMTLYRWRRALGHGARALLNAKKPKTDPQIKQLEQENSRLKKALAMQTQDLMLLKKETNLV